MPLIFRLKVTSGSPSSYLTKTKYRFKQVSAYGAFSTMMKRLVSSANQRMLDPLTISFMKRRKSKAPE